MLKEHFDIQPRRGWLKKTYWGLVQAEKFLGHFFLLIIRLFWGSQLVLVGLGKWVTLREVSLYFQSLDIPLPLFSAALVATIELIGGILLFAGFLSRLITILLISVFITAYATAHKAIFTHFFSNPTLFTTQDPFLFLYGSLVIFCFGAGMFSVDYWLEKKAFGQAL